MLVDVVHHKVMAPTTPSSNRKPVYEGPADGRQNLLA